MKLISKIAFSFVFLFSFLVPNQTLGAASFIDVDESHRFYDEIVYLTDKKIITGFPDGSFKPNQTVTRAQAAIMIGRALGLDGTQRNTKFTDVNANVTASGYIDSAVEKGIITGFPDNTYRPDAPVTRGQMAIFLSRAYNLTEEANISFSDVTPNMAAYTHVKRILAEGLTNGYHDGTFRPDNKISRSDFSAFMARALDDKFKGVEKQLKVHFIDVGQGDSSLVVTPNGKTILIDGGPKSAGEKVVDYLKQAGISSIDLLVATHPDADHIGGLIDVMNEITVKKVLDSGKTHTSQTYLDYLTIIDSKNILFEVAQEGSSISLDSDIQIKILNSSTGSEDNNESSIVLKITYGQIDYLFTGDAEVEQEQEMVAKYNVEAEILKVGHHGSNTSSSQEFINEVKPKVSILSYGKGNSYGHPYSEVVNRLKAFGSELYSTAESGDIVVTTNGQTYSVSANPWDGGDIQEPPVSDSISITDVNLETEVVTIKNNGNTDIDMTGWKLVSEEGNQTFDFPNGYVLKVGKVVYVTSGNNAVDNPPTHLKWTGAYIWNNSGDAALLYNSQGELVSEFR